MANLLETRKKALAEECARIREGLGDKRTASQLTLKEQKILRCVAWGMSDQDIATYMGISKGTVHVHVGRIHDKTVVSSRPALAVAAYEVFKTMGQL